MITKTYLEQKKRRPALILYRTQKQTNDDELIQSMLTTIIVFSEQYLLPKNILLESISLEKRLVRKIFNLKQTISTKVQTSTNFPF